MPFSLPCDKIQDSLQLLVIAGSKSRTLVDDKITIIFRKYLVIDIWYSWHRLISGMKLALQVSNAKRRNADLQVHVEDCIDERGFTRAFL